METHASVSIEELIRRCAASRSPEAWEEFVRRFHLAGFNLHIHAINDAAVRTAVDAIEAARAADGIATQHDAIAHVQEVLKPTFFE